MNVFFPLTFFCSTKVLDITVVYAASIDHSPTYLSPAECTFYNPTHICPFFRACKAAHLNAISNHPAIIKGPLIGSSFTGVGI